MPHLYQVSLLTAYQGVKCVNIFNYTIATRPVNVSGSLALATAFGAVNAPQETANDIPAADDMITNLRKFLSEGVQFVEATVINVYDVVDFYQAAFPAGIDGIRAGDALPATMAWSFTSSVVRRDIKRGQKRFTGIPEAFITNGTLDLTNAPLVKGALERNMVYTSGGSTFNFAPCVVSKEQYTPDANRPTRKAYRYRSEATQFDHIATGLLWTARNYPSTQASRQRGRGN
jgi:hypothetical protein